MNENGRKAQGSGRAMDAPDDKEVEQYPGKEGRSVGSPFRNKDECAHSAYRPWLHRATAQPAPTTWGSDMKRKNRRSPVEAAMQGLEEFGRAIRASRAVNERNRLRLGADEEKNSPPPTFTRRNFGETKW